ncbi:MAG: phosphoenolpyruvate hydrolase family protein, partial [Acidobacteriota bacterium]
MLDTLSDGACLHARLGKQCEPVRLTDSEILQQRAPNAPPFLQAAFGRKDDFTVQFFVRMLFSCLVDADFQDTEAFMNPGNSAARPAWPGDVLAKMEAALAVYLDGLGASGGEVNRSRAEVLEACRRATVRPPGLFTLTVPTGGGKTLSSLAFALGHARRHGLNRVIYVVPFTSIIEQNASVFRDVMRPLVRGSVADPVVEHHSHLDPKVETTENRLAAENWDAPIVVTTAVQFYESLFSNRTSRCRKLHNLSRAVVILDEAQCLPVDYLGPCLRALKELTENYETTVVLCTATQPAVARRDGFGIGLDLDASNEIIPDPPSLYSALRRVTVEDVGTLPDDDLVKRLMQCEQVLCIVNTRRHALRLWNRLDEEDGHFHLSGSMCPEHRSATLSKIRRRLDMGSVCRVVSTQLVEAGVDMVVAHMGNTAGGTTGSKTTTPLDEAVERIQAICDAVKEASPDAFVIAHGGHMKAPEDVAYILGHTKNV